MSPTHKRLVEKLLAPGLCIPVLKAHRGATAAEAFVVHGVFKVGPPEAIGQELDIYQDLQTRLGVQYSDIFPQVVLRYRDEQVAFFEMTWLGRSLKDEIFAPLAWGEWTAVLAQWPDAPPIVAKLALADEAVARTLDYLETLFTTSQQADPNLAATFASETVVALRSSLQHAGLLSQLKRDLAAVEEAQDVWSTGLAISCCHRDLTTQNIYVARYNGALAVRLADPRPGMPYFEETSAGRTRIPNSLGCAAVDLAHLEVSLIRRQLELKHIHSGVELAALDRVRTCVRDWLTFGRFSAQFYELALTAWYAAYAAWFSPYHIAPERRWLHDYIITEVSKRLAHCAAIARGEAMSS